MAAAIWLGAFLGGVTGRRAAILDFCASRLNVAADLLALTHDDLGAPLLLFEGARSEWGVSSSSRENIALFGLSRERIGVDMEFWEPIAPAWNVLHEGEKAALSAMPEDRRAEAFLRLWTAKEAYLKALGVGLGREPTEIRIYPGGETFGIADRERAVVTSETRFWRENLEGRAVLCACVTLPGR